jgi:hypothetical protein
MNKSNLPEEIEREQRLWERNAKLGFLEITLCIYIWASSILGQQNNNNKLIIGSTGRFSVTDGSCSSTRHRPNETARTNKSCHVDPCKPNWPDPAQPKHTGRSVFNGPVGFVQAYLQLNHGSHQIYIKRTITNFPTLCLCQHYYKKK